MWIPSLKAGVRNMSKTAIDIFFVLELMKERDIKNLTFYFFARNKDNGWSEGGAKGGDEGESKGGAKGRRLVKCLGERLGDSKAQEPGSV